MCRKDFSRTDEDLTYADVYFDSKDRPIAVAIKGTLSLAKPEK
jgi:hypothetical protein